ncbi:MAG: ABC transporter ATP-binding protein [Bacteroidetes bacterium]|nr:ABC transporter ATP-binding protein [Bacteroidota bacterium]MBX7044525.1 ABC transporter ATP-binding protein [Ignavibacteria bacterium]
MEVISTKNLKKEYKGSGFSKERITALKNFSFTVNEGDIFGLLGPNGAGKTTLVKILLGIVYPTEGDASIFGESIKNEKYKTKIGYLPENHKFPNYLTGEQVLHYFGMLSGLSNAQVKSRSDEYLKIVDMEKWKKTKIKKYSKGMMQRLGIAQAMINEPDLIFLDEPTDGVDPIGRKEIRDILIGLKDKGKTIFLNSHLLSEIELICNKVAILNKGELIKEGTIDEITSTGNKHVFTTSDLSDDVINILLNQYFATLHGKNEFIVNSDSAESLNTVIDILRKNNVNILSLTKEKNTLENMFINLIEQQN